MTLSLILSAAVADPSAFSQNQSPNEFDVIVQKSSEAHEGVFSVPPITSWRGSVSFAKAGASDETVSPRLSAWVATSEAVNGLQGSGLRPWHVTIGYQLFDEDGDMVHSGTIDEVWVAPKQYRIQYSSDALNQTDYATENGLFRAGDQRWPTPLELAARTTALSPFADASGLRGLEPRLTELSSGSLTLSCTALTRGNPPDFGSTEYCFDPKSGALRYSHSASWTQTAFNHVEILQGRFVAQNILVTDGGHPQIKITITRLETLQEFDSSKIVPPTNATLIGSEPLHGVRLTPIHTEFPEWPSSVGKGAFTVKVDLVVGKDGRVKSAHSISGPENALKAAEKTALRWRFQPYLVLGEPVEVETQIGLSQN